MKLTKTAVDDLKAPSGKTDFIAFFDKMPGFGVRIQNGGSKYYVAQWNIGKKGGRISLGNVNKITLDAAITQARAIFSQAQDGINPTGARSAKKQKAGQAIAPLIDRFLKANQSGWSEKYYKDTERSLKVYFKKLHAKALTEITRSDVADELATVQQERGDVSRNRSRAALSKFFNWAIGEGLCEYNPAERTNKAPEVARDRELSESELRRLWLSVEAENFSQDERDVIRLMILTLQREAQIGDLKVAETDIDRQQLVYQRARVKNKGGGKHVIPLAPEALKIIKSRGLDGREFVFGRFDSGFANYTHLKEKIDDIVKFNEPWIFHDLRRTGKTAMSEHLEVAGEVSEAILNHGKKDMDKVYNNAQYLKQKLNALTKWENYVMAIVRANTALAA